MVNSSETLACGAPSISASRTLSLRIRDDVANSALTVPARFPFDQSFDQLIVLPLIRFGRNGCGHNL
jgi:hypothetical protein